jgi:uncharacterized GH25 family protein
VSRTFVLTVAAVALVAAPVAAHDYWLLPEKFVAKPGEEVPTHLYYGDDFVPENERPYQKDRTPYFALVSAGSTVDLAATLSDGSRPAAALRPGAPGTYLLVHDRNAQNIVLKGTDFDRYLQEEGLEAIRAERRRRGEDTKDGRERYSRSIKTLVQVGLIPDATATRHLNRPIEIVPLVNPYTLRPGQSLTVRVFFEGKPLADQQIDALHRQGNRTNRLSARTDAAGQASFQLAEPGAWLLRLVHMERCRRDCAAIDWESFWSSLSFALPPAPATP